MPDHDQRTVSPEPLLLFRYQKRRATGARDRLSWDPCTSQRGDGSCRVARFSSCLHYLVRQGTLEGQELCSLYYAGGACVAPPLAPLKFAQGIRPIWRSERARWRGRRRRASHLRSSLLARRALGRSTSKPGVAMAGCSSSTCRCAGTWTCPQWYVCCTCAGPRNGVLVLHTRTSGSRLGAPCTGCALPGRLHTRMPPVDVCMYLQRCGATVLFCTRTVPESQHTSRPGSAGICDRGATTGADEVTTRPRDPGGAPFGSSR
jgi:hypothetical protein